MAERLRGLLQYPPFLVSLAGVAVFELGRERIGLSLSCAAFAANAAVLIWRAARG